MSASTCDAPGCLILMIDESAAMDSPVQDDSNLALGQQPKSKGDAVATAINALLKQLTGGPDFEVALVGYQTDAQGEAVAVSRWDGALAGRDFVPLGEIVRHPLIVEKRARKLPDPGSFAGFREETVEFPVWYASRRNGVAPQVRAFQHCRNLVANWLATAPANAGQPLVLNIFAGASGDGNPLKAIQEIRDLSAAPGSPLVFHLHLAASSLVPPTVYSSNRTFLPVGQMRDVFDRASVLTPAQIAALKEAKTPVSANARGMACNARMPDVVKFLSLVKAHTKTWPSWTAAGVKAAAPQPVETPAAPLPAVETIPPVETISAAAVLPASDAYGTAMPELPAASEPEDLVAATAAGGLEKAALVVFLVDRSLDDPFAGDTRSAFARLQEHANDLLGKLSKSASGLVDAAVVSYGLDATGEPEVRTTFEGALTGRSIVRDTELSNGALRVDEIEQQVPNGVGGLMAIPVKKTIFVELDPTTAASPVSAFQAVRAILDEWRELHPSSCVAPVVVHLTRGRLLPEDLDEAVAQFANCTGPAGGVNLFHLVATEHPHPSLAYSDGDSDLQGAELQKLWAVSSLLLGREALAASKPSLVKPESRGIVVNGKFDLLLEGISASLA